MALWNRSSYLMVARLLPIVLVLSAGFFWKYEKVHRLQTEKRLKTVSEQLVKSQTDLASAQEEAQTANEEKRFLIQQLGQRDEHIRRLLAEMIKLLSGSGSVDLGEVLVRSKDSSAWDGVRNEMQNIISQKPIGQATLVSAPAQIAPAEVAQAVKAAPVTPAMGLRQTQVESSRALPSAPISVAMPGQSGVLAANGSSSGAAGLFDARIDRGGQILTVNVEHKFVVISQGSDNGLKQDARFDAFAGNEKIGRVQIGTVYDRISTASILDGDIKLFREGSPIRLEPVK